MEAFWTATMVAQPHVMARVLSNWACQQVKRWYIQSRPCSSIPSDSNFSRVLANYWEIVGVNIRDMLRGRCLSCGSSEGPRVVSCQTSTGHAHIYGWNWWLSYPQERLRSATLCTEERRPHNGAEGHDRDQPRDLRTVTNTNSKSYHANRKFLSFFSSFLFFFIESSVNTVHLCSKGICELCILVMPKSDGVIDAINSSAE